MTTINYKDPSLLATTAANGIMSSDDKNKLAHLGLLDGYATVDQLNSEISRAEAAEQEIRSVLDGYGTGTIDGYILDGYAPRNNISRVYFVDGGTSVPLDKQNGNIETPFAYMLSVPSAIPTTGAGAIILVAPGDYTNEGELDPDDFTGRGPIAIVNLAISLAGDAGSYALNNTVSLRTINHDNVTTIQGCQVLNVISDTAQIRNSILYGSCSVNSGFCAQSSIILRTGTVPTISINSGQMRFDSCVFQTDGDVIFKMDGLPIEMYRCTLTAAITIHFSGAAGTLKMDNFTYQQWLSLGCVLDNGTIQVVDASPPVSLDGYATIAYVDSHTPLAHASSHIAGGSDPLDGYHIPLDYTPTNYTAPVDGYIGEHIAALDNRFSQIVPTPYTTVTIDVSLTSTANTTIDTRPASPSGINRWKLISIDLRLKTTVTGGGSSVIGIGSTSGGQQIVLNQTVDGYVAQGAMVGGLALSTLGSDMSQINGFEAMYPASQNIYANVTNTGTVTTGTVTVYLLWQELP